MAVLNATPDSFYDGGVYVGEQAVARVSALAKLGAFVIDVGGESTRPGAPPVSAVEQIERIEPALKAALTVFDRSRGPWVSVDTYDPEVAERALSWGVQIVNDVSCLAQSDLARVVAKAGATLVLMHARGSNEQMLGFSEYPEAGYGDVVADVTREWVAARERAIRAGLSSTDILFDPGLGFAKSARQSMELLRRIGDFSALSAPIVVGPSRKSFLKLVEDRPPADRLGATIAACLHAAQHGAKLVRVHDVEVIGQALRAQRILRMSNDRPRTVGEESCSTPS